MIEINSDIEMLNVRIKLIEFNMKTLGAALSARL